MNFTPYGISRFLFEVFMRIFFRVTASGTSNVPDPPYILVANHVSLLDAPLMVSYIPQFINALEAKEHFDWPFYGKLITKWGNIPINRTPIPRRFD